MLNQRKNVKSNKQKIIKIEDIIDESYSNEKYKFKLIIQTEKDFKNLIDDFFQFKYYLVIYFHNYIL